MHTEALLQRSFVTLQKRNFIPGFGVWPSFRAKELHVRFQNRNCTTVFTVQPSFRAKGVHLKFQTYLQPCWCNNWSPHPILFFGEEFLRRGAFRHRRFCTEKSFTPRNSHAQKLLHTEVSTQGSFYTEEFSHTDAFTQKVLHTQEFTHRSSQKLLHSGVSTQRSLSVYRETFTHRSFLHREANAFTCRIFYTEKVLHTDAFT